MAARAHPEHSAPATFTSTSLDDAIWLHCPARFDRWHLYTQETVAVLLSPRSRPETIHDSDRRLVATVMQEVLVRPAR
jgi:acyl-CoA thioesterase II